MQLTIYRTYHKEGTNGSLYADGAFVCYTIELPWRGNQPRLSCIPEGSYTVVRRHSPRHGWHLAITGVPHRYFILVHAANDALKELEGCIAPVTQLTAQGRGLASRAALHRLEKLVFPAIEKGTVTLHLLHRYARMEESHHTAATACHLKEAA